MTKILRLELPPEINPAEKRTYAPEDWLDVARMRLRSPLLLVQEIADQQAPPAYARVRHPLYCTPPGMQLPSCGVVCPAGVSADKVRHHWRCAIPPSLAPGPSGDDILWYRRTRVSDCSYIFVLSVITIPHFPWLSDGERSRQTRRLRLPWCSTLTLTRTATAARQAASMPASTREALYCNKVPYMSG